MASLTAHLRRPDDHGRLAFHPECPVCRGERLAGALPPDAVVGRRAQAVIAAGVLAFASATPTAVLAAEPVQEQEGAAAPDQVPADDAPSAPGFDPGGRPSDLPFTATPEAAAPASPDPADDGTVPLEQEPATDEDAPLADPGDGTGTQSAGEQQAPVLTDPVPAAPSPPPTAPAAPSEPPASPPAVETPATTPAEPAPGVTAPSHARKPDTAREVHRPPRPTVPQTLRAQPAPRPAPVIVASTPATAHVAQAQPAASSPAVVNHRRAARRADRVHVVRREESLWSIAADALGAGASAARIAREVNRLWELNSDRIGTGDRDLLIAGTRLTL